MNEGNAVFHRLIILILSLSACFSGIAQENIWQKPVKIVCDSCTISESLEQLENQTGYYFSYNTGLFSENKKITLHLSGEKLKDVLDSVINDTSIYYKLVERQIVLSREKKKETEVNETPGILKNLTLRISGKVTDAGSNVPVSFANIAVVGKPVGTVANTDGDFILKLPTAFENDSIGISCIGYKILFIPVQEALSTQIFPLETDFVPIQEVIIRNTDPVNLIRNALNKIPENYCLKPAVITSFYRETIKKGEDFVAITEAVLQTYKNGYANDYAVDRIKLLKGRKTKNIHPQDTIIIKLKAGPGTTLLLDLVKNPAEFLQEEYFQFYRYRLSDIIIDDDEETYVIDFRQKEEIKEPLYYGKIYIGVKDLALKGFEFALNEEGIEKAWDRFVIKKPGWMKVKPVKAAYSVFYKSYQTKYYINSIRSETVFRIRNKRKMFSDEFSSKIEMAVTHIDTGDVNPFRFRSTINTEAILDDEFTESPESYWWDYNYIKPDEPLTEAIEKRINP